MLTFYPCPPSPPAFIPLSNHNFMGSSAQPIRGPGGREENAFNLLHLVLSRCFPPVGYGHLVLKASDRGAPWPLCHHNRVKCACFKHLPEVVFLSVIKTQHLPWCAGKEELKSFRIAQLHATLRSPQFDLLIGICTAFITSAAFKVGAHEAPVSRVCQELL